MLYWTVEQLRAQYEVLRGLTPFNKRTWHLPSGDKISFQLILDRETRGEWRRENNADFLGWHHVIRISNPVCRTLPRMIETMMHEMCHIEQWERGERSHHGAIFNTLADQVCKVHGWERGMF